MYVSNSVNGLSWVITAVGAGFALTCAFLLLHSFRQVLRKERFFEGRGRDGLRTLIVSLLVIGALGIGLYAMPSVFMDGRSWQTVQAEFPPSTMYALFAACTGIVMFYLYFLMQTFFVKPEERSFFTISTFSIVSGSSYAFVMFIVNQALASDVSKLGLGGYFLLGLVLYVFGQRLVRAQLTTMTNRMLFQIRTDLIGKLLRTPYYRMERIGKEKIYTTLNNDTEVISNSIGLIVIGITSSVTIITSFVYLGVSDLSALFTSVLLFVVAGFLIATVNKSAAKLFSQSRDTQNVFFRFINDLLGGFKELYLHKGRRDEFHADMVASCDQYRNQRIKADLVSANVYFAGELVAFIILGGLVFLLPVVISSVQNATLSDYVLVFLFLKGPLDNVLNMVPRITLVRVSWRRIQQIREQIAGVETDKLEEQVEIVTPLTIEMRDVEFAYQSEERESFAVGPLSCSFASGEIVFITGGNGSGKSTLARLATGLFAPDKGTVYVNGRATDAEHLGQYYSTVFADYYLFEKLYGLDHRGAEAQMDQHLHELGIAEKVAIVDGAFSTTKLSTGQKKRLALMISYLEDRPVYLFDEWAADQDPEFRQHFYEELLPELKARGKCVIAITHDDRYFDLADKVIKMEAGQILEAKVLVS